MEDLRPHDSDEVGSEFSILGMLVTRAKTRAALHEVARHIKPGMTEEEAARLTRSVLTDAAMARTRHPVIVRFGINTAKPLTENPTADVVLAENDIFFISIGPRYGEWESDGGATFVVGDTVAHLRCARDVVTLFHESRATWIEKGLTGVELYRHAADAALKAGWILSPSVAGHRIPHHLHATLQERNLAEFDRRPDVMRWVLECHIVEPRGKFGAFFGDLLLPDEYY